MEKRTETAAAPGAREVPRLDLLEGPLLRAWAFFVATAGRSAGRESHATEMIGARVARPDLACYYRPEKKRRPVAREFTK